MGEGGAGRRSLHKVGGGFTLVPGSQSQLGQQWRAHSQENPNLSIVSPTHSPPWNFTVGWTTERFKNSFLAMGPFIQINSTWKPKIQTNNKQTALLWEGRMELGLTYLPHFSPEESITSPSDL